MGEHSDDPERVIIVGGGPAGMAAALFLVAEGVPVAVLERGVERHSDPRAATYHPPTLEMLEPSGVTAELHQRGIVARRWQYRDRREGLVAELDLELLRGETRYPYRLQCEQHKLVAMMERRVAASPLAQIRHGAEVIGVEQDEHSVAALVQDAGGVRERIAGRYLVGADGGRSLVRKSQGIGFEGFTWPERFLVITTAFDFEPLGFAYSSYTMDPVEWTATFKVPGEGRGLWRCVFPADPQEDERELLDHTHAQRRLQGFVAHAMPYEIVHTNLYSVHQRVATCYRAGRVLLAGDAAHVNNPLGGMGLNFGIHDAHDLAGKLARVWRGDAPADLLDHYDRQRRTVAERFLQAQSIENKHTLEERDPAAREARKAEMRRIAADPELARRFLLRTSMIEGLRAAAAIP
jgi:3-(3-hydroxy-phenyl)propionate hydroxylase